MGMIKRPPVENGTRLILLSILPFPLAILTTFLFVFTIGRRFPRDIAPGSSLMLPGVLLSIAVMLVTTAYVRRRWIEDAPRRFSLFLCALTSMMAWPVWTVGTLPSVNGMSLGEARTSGMRLERLTMSQASKGRRLYYWASLAPAVSPSRIGAGRYFVPKEIYDDWELRTGENVQVVHASGLLGAETLLDYRR